MFQNFQNGLKWSTIYQNDLKLYKTVKWSKTFQYNCPNGQVRSKFIF